MAMYDIHNHLNEVLALDPQVIATDTTTNGNSIDMNGSAGDFEALEFVMTVGLYTDGDYNLALEESDDNSIWAAVDAANVVGTATVVSADNTVTSLGYVGKKRYARANVVSASTTTGATLTVTALQKRARNRPV